MLVHESVPTWQIIRRGTVKKARPCQIQTAEAVPSSACTKWLHTGRPWTNEPEHLDQRIVTGSPHPGHETPPSPGMGAIHHNRRPVEFPVARNTIAGTR